MSVNFSAPISTANNLHHRWKAHKKDEHACLAVDRANEEFRCSPVGLLGTIDFRGNFSSNPASQFAEFRALENCLNSLAFNLCMFNV